MDPLLCGDACPDPSRHSENKLVPDLFAWKPGYLLVIEMKPSFSVQDEQKLISLLTTRRNHLHLALETFAKDRSMPFLANPEALGCEYESRDLLRKGIRKAWPFQYTDQI